MKIIHNESPKWLMVYSIDGISATLELMLKSKYNVKSITVVLKEYKK